jgi:hypothetical protein
MGLKGKAAEDRGAGERDTEWAQKITPGSGDWRAAVRKGVKKELREDNKQTSKVWRCGGLLG